MNRWRITLRPDGTVDAVELVIPRPLELRPTSRPLGAAEGWILPIASEGVTLELPTSSSESGLLRIDVLLETGNLELEIDSDRDDQEQRFGATLGPEVVTARELNVEKLTTDVERPEGTVVHEYRLPSDAVEQTPSAELVELATALVDTSPGVAMRLATIADRIDGQHRRGGGVRGFLSTLTNGQLHRLTGVLCRSCQQPIRWETTPAGKAIPLDPDPHPSGNVDVVYVGGELVAIVLGPADAVSAQAAGHKLYRSHFATCPNADAHRKRAT